MSNTDFWRSRPAQSNTQVFKSMLRVGRACIDTHLWRAYTLQH